MRSMHRGRRSLASVRSGEAVTIRAILFQEIRSACEGVGVREGETVTCTRSGPSGIHLRTNAGETAALSVATARFVEVDPATRSARQRPDHDPVRADPGLALATTTRSHPAA